MWLMDNQLKLLTNKLLPHKLQTTLHTNGPIASTFGMILFVKGHLNQGLWVQI
jgi:hypothetical protein